MVISLWVNGLCIRFTLNPLHFFELVYPTLMVEDCYIPLLARYFFAAELSDSDWSNTIEHLRAIRDDLGILKSDIKEIKQRISNLESHVALLHGDFSNQSHRMDRLEERVERIERRLELTSG